MAFGFFQSPILKFFYEDSKRHWELDGSAQPTSIIMPRHRQSWLVSPIPKSNKVRGKAAQLDFLGDDTGQ